MTNAEDVAKYLIELGHDRGMPINNAQLQRLLYYVQAWHLAERDRPMFADKFQAWIYGPTIPSIYMNYNRHGWHPLPRPETVPGLADTEASFVREIADDYLALDEWQLEELACRESPWLNARGGIDRLDACTTELSEDDMRAYFRRLKVAA